MTSIGEFAFADCSNLKSVTIGAGVESIGNCSFQNCPLTEIHCRMEIPLDINESVFTLDEEYYSLENKSPIRTISNTCILYVPTGCADAYRSAPVWGGKNIVEENDAGIKSADKAYIKITADNGKIFVSGANGDTAISVYDLNGRRIYCGVDNIIEILFKGLYIVYVEGNPYKVLL